LKFWNSEKIEFSYCMKVCYNYSRVKLIESKISCSHNDLITSVTEKKLIWLTKIEKKLFKLKFCKLNLNWELVNSMRYVLLWATSTSTVLLSCSSSLNRIIGYSLKCYLYSLKDHYQGLTRIIINNAKLQ